MSKRDKDIYWIKKDDELGDKVWWQCPISQTSTKVIAFDRYQEMFDRLVASSKKEIKIGESVSFFYELYTTALKALHTIKDQPLVDKRTPEEIATQTLDQLRDLHSKGPGF